MKFNLTFVNKVKVATDAWRLNFEKPAGFENKPGQFLHVNLPHPHHDDRGVKRWFTISSSPTEEFITITTRHVKDHPSTFKNALFELKKGESFAAEGPEGKFVLPSDKSTKLAWVAGGIGITPFISQMRYMLDTKDLQRDIMLFYGNRHAEDIVCPVLLKEVQAKFTNFQLIRVFSESARSFVHDHTETGFIDEKLITKYVLDYNDREFFVSGPEPMVDSFKLILDFLGVREDRIHQDWFPGYKNEFVKRSVV